MIGRPREASDDGSARAPLRFSLAGVQLKFSAVMEATGGLTVPADGIGGSWIVKLPSARFPAVPQNEFVTMGLARRIGIPVPRTRLVPVHEIVGLPDDVAAVGDLAFAVERFDRGPGRSRIHMEDFAQVFGLYPERKYGRRSCAGIASVLSAEAGPEAVEDFVRRLAFSVLTGNADMHLKNWSLVYADGVTPSLSPAYDLLSTIPYLPNDRFALTFGGTKGHPWNHQGADSPVCRQGGSGRRSALARGAGDGGRDGRSVAPSRREGHVAGRYPHLAGPSPHRSGRSDAGVPHDSLTMSSVFRTMRRGGAPGFSIRSTSADAACRPISSRDTVVTVSGGFARLASSTSS